MNRLRSLIQFMLSNFGPILIFIAAKQFFGLKSAIAVSVVYSIAEAAIQGAQGKQLTLFFKFSLAITLAFGLIDLGLKDSFLYRYEAVSTNVLTGLFFAATLFRGKPLIQEFYEQRPGALKVLTPDRVRFFRLLTAIWVAYFFLKATAYAWVASHYTYEQALLFRSTAGTASLYVLLFASIALGKHLYMLCKRLGVLGPSEPLPS